ncbi:MAG: putative ATPase [Chloroflexi bacterium]|nr:MAG: putative ATPase [Chloroflexota bacterium]
MNLFKQNSDNILKATAPLSTRMRPRSFQEFFGQEHLLGPERALRKIVDSDQIFSMIFWGPPGSGKTTLSLLISRITKSKFIHISAAVSGVSELRTAIRDAEELLGMTGQKTIVFIDEIHRFNKSQQDVILPHVESGAITLIGATTENPSFEITGPLLSRSRVFKLKPIDEDHMESILNRAINDTEHGIGEFNAMIEPSVMGSLISLSGGDARIALNTIELAVASIDIDESGHRNITLQVIQDVMQRSIPSYDKKGDQHYDLISAFIKSVRGSDPDSSIYWLARMIDAGEDPLFIARRIVILAAEDVGLADPRALSISIAAYQATHFIGMPEARIPLSEATIYLATAPKSNSAYKAIDFALEDASLTPNEVVPLHLRNPVTELMEDEGYGEGYKYSHNYDNHFASMQNRPNKIKDHVYYTPSDQGYEIKIQRWHNERWNKNNKK